MIYDKPVWLPNVILINLSYDIEKDLLNTCLFLKKFTHKIPLISVFIDHSYADIVTSQIIIKQKDYSIYKEDRIYDKALTSKLLNTGLKHLYYIIPNVNNYKTAFVHLLDILGIELPVICITKGLTGKLNPAITLEFDSENIDDNSISFKEIQKKEICFENKVFLIK